MLNNAFCSRKIPVLMRLYAQLAGGLRQGNPVIEIIALLRLCLHNAQCKGKYAGIGFTHAYFARRNKTVEAAVQVKLLYAVII